MRSDLGFGIPGRTGLLGIAGVFSGIPHTEENASPIAEPVTTATMGLHQRNQPAPPAEELTRYRPNPTAAPRAVPIRYFMGFLLPLQDLCSMIR